MRRDPSTRVPRSTLTSASPSPSSDPPAATISRLCSALRTRTHRLARARGCTRAFARGRVQLTAVCSGPLPPSVQRVMVCWRTRGACLHLYARGRVGAVHLRGCARACTRRESVRAHRPLRPRRSSAAQTRPLARPTRRVTVTPCRRGNMTSCRRVTVTSCRRGNMTPCRRGAALTRPEEVAFTRQHDIITALKLVALRVAMRASIHCLGVEDREQHRTVRGGSTRV